MVTERHARCGLWDTQTCFPAPQASRAGLRRLRPAGPQLPQCEEVMLALGGCNRAAGSSTRWQAGGLVDFSLLGRLAGATRCNACAPFTWAIGIITLGSCAQRQPDLPLTLMHDRRVPEQKYPMPAAMVRTRAIRIRGKGSRTLNNADAKDASGDVDYAARQEGRINEANRSVQNKSSYRAERQTR